MPLGHDLDALEIKEPNVTLLQPLLAELEFRSLAKRLLQSVGNFQDETGKRQQAGQNEQQIDGPGDAAGGGNGGSKIYSRERTDT